MVARSHPLTYRRKIAKLDNDRGRLFLVPLQAVVGDVVVLLGNGGIPFVLRAWKNKKNSADSGLWKRLQVWLYGEERMCAICDEEGRIVDADILMTMSATEPEMSFERVRHFVLVGECYVERLMGKRDQGSQVRGEVVFALH